MSIIFILFIIGFSFGRNQSDINYPKDGNQKEFVFNEGFDSIIDDMNGSNVHKLAQMNRIQRTKRNKNTFYESFHKFEEIVNELKRIENSFPKTTKLLSLGKTYENRDIYAINVAKDFQKRIIIIECGSYGYDWMSVAVCLWTLNELLNENIKPLYPLLDYYQFTVIPVLNPDGYVYSWETDRNWRKNRQKAKSKFCTNNTYGIDINRNWDTPMFGYNSGTNPCDYDTYPGTKPFTARESKALRNYLIDKRHLLVAYFQFVTYAHWIPSLRRIMYSWRYRSAEGPDYDFHRNLLNQSLTQANRTKWWNRDGRAYLSHPDAEKAGGSAFDFTYMTLYLKPSFVVLLPNETIDSNSQDIWAIIQSIFSVLGPEWSTTTSTHSSSLRLICGFYCKIYFSFLNYTLIFVSIHYFF